MTQQSIRKEVQCAAAGGYEWSMEPCSPERGCAPTQAFYALRHPRGFKVLVRRLSNCRTHLNKVSIIQKGG